MKKYKNSFNEKDIVLTQGIDKKFFQLLKKLYSPFLSSTHLKDKFKFTIFFKDLEYPIGVVSLNKGENTFTQIALIPEMMGKGLGKYVYFTLLNLPEIKKFVQKIDWTAKRENYPSLKLLYELGGGIFEDNIIRQRRSYEGFFRVNKKVSEKMRECLEKVLPMSKEWYKEWYQKEYSSRKKELILLREYLEEYGNKY